MSVEEITFPVAETFYSIQGEGLYAGTPMFFIRLAGCNVGKPVNVNMDWHRKETNPFQILHPEHTTCTSFSGKQFVCDTDYRVKEQMTLEQLLQLHAETDAYHVSITGGEPLIHKQLPELCHAFINRDIWVNIETSGTLPLSALPWGRERLTITCSPKHNFLVQNMSYIDQFKILVEDETDIAIAESLDAGNIPIFIQPIERYDANGPIKSSYDFVVDVVKKHPTWRLSLQLHKILGVR